MFPFNPTSFLCSKLLIYYNANVPGEKNDSSLSTNISRRTTATNANDNFSGARDIREAYTRKGGKWGGKMARRWIISKSGDKWQGWVLEIGQGSDSHRANVHDPQFCFLTYKVSMILSTLHSALKIKWGNVQILLVWKEVMTMSSTSGPWDLRDPYARPHLAPAGNVTSGIATRFPLSKMGTGLPCWPAHEEGNVQGTFS